jgi:sugar lactone lactonase YvrE
MSVRVIAHDLRDVLGEGPVWSAREHAPGFIAGFASGFAQLTLEPTRIVAMVDPEPERPQNRLNDAKADRCGRIWAGSMAVACSLRPLRRVSSTSRMQVLCLRVRAAGRRTGSGAESRGYI